MEDNYKIMKEMFDSIKFDDLEIVRSVDVNHYLFNEQIMNSLFKGRPTFIADDSGNYCEIKPVITFLTISGITQPAIVFKVSEKRYTSAEAKQILEDYINSMKGGAEKNDKIL